jgi:hypothetical protein
MGMHLRLAWAAVVVSLIPGCGSGDSSAAGFGVDAGPETGANVGGDTGAGGRVDAAAPDAASPDAGGATHDASAPEAAGPHDSGLAVYDQVAPTPPAQWQSVTGNLAGLSSECGNVGGIYPDPHGDLLIAGVALQGLWASTDGAATWTSIGTSGQITNRLSSIVYDPANTSTFWESGIYGWEKGTDGVFVTTNNGGSFAGVDGLSKAQNGGNTNDSIAIDFSDPQRKTMLAGTHEQAQVLYLSTDAGMTWTNIGAALPSTLGFCTSTLVVNTTTLLVGCAASWSGKAGAIVRSTDTGATFTQVDAKGVSGQPLWASDGTIYWAEEGGGIVMSTDEGMTWTEIANSSTAGTLRPLELPDGRIVSAQQQNIVIAPPKGTTWKTIGSPMPYAPNGMSYSPFRNAFYIWYFTCSGTNAVPSDGFMQFGWDYR